MHLPFNDVRYSPNTSSNVNYFLFVADMKCGLYEIKKKTTQQCYKWTESGPKKL